MKLDQSVLLTNYLTMLRYYLPRTGQKYVGEFVADKCHGKGKQVWPDACLRKLALAGAYFGAG